MEGCLPRMWGGGGCCASLGPASPTCGSQDASGIHPLPATTCPLQTLGCLDHRQSWLRTSHWSWFPTISPTLSVSRAWELRTQWALREAAVEATPVNTGGLKGLEFFWCANHRIIDFYFSHAIRHSRGVWLLVSWMPSFLNSTVPSCEALSPWLSFSCDAHGHSVPS